jgi:AcrR family transcriptional regulator
MGNFNLADAAKAILVEGAKESFDSNISSKQGGKDKPSKLPTSVAYGNKDAGKVGDAPEEMDDTNPDYTKGTPTATPPGATPPVGSQPAAKLKGQPGEDAAAGTTPVQQSATDYSSIRDRVKAKLAKQTMQANPGAVAPYVPEETEYDEEVVSEEKEEGHEDAAQDKAMIKKMMKKEKMKEQMQQDVGALLSGENLSEEFKDKATTIFEAAVIARTQSLMEDIEQALFEEFEVAVEEVKEDLAAKLDDYINYMAEEWLKENQLAVEKGLRAEIVESFINGMKDLFEDHYIDIPEEKVDVVEGLTSKVEELEASLDEQIQSAIEMKKELNEHKKIEAIHAVCEGLTQTQVEKMKSLAEGVEFTTDEEFADKLVTLRESYFNEPVNTSGSSALNEEVDIEDEKKTNTNVDPTIAKYAQTISKTLVK